MAAEPSFGTRPETCSADSVSAPALAWTPGKAVIFFCSDSGKLS
jgi:hypothetical protein